MRRHTAIYPSPVEPQSKPCCRFRPHGTMHVVRQSQTEATPDRSDARLLTYPSTACCRLWPHGRQVSRSTVERLGRSQRELQQRVDEAEAELELARERNSETVS